MKLQLNKFIKNMHDLSATPLMALTLCCVLLCGMMYTKMLDTNRLCIQLAAQLEELQSTVQITDSEVPLANSNNDLHAGDIVTVKIYAEEVSDLYGYEFKLNFDESMLEYQELSSLIPEIGTIFQKPYDGFLLVGATKVGDEPGFSAVDTPVCEIVLSVMEDGIVPDLSISEVNVVNSNLEYTESVSDWSLELE